MHTLCCDRWSWNTYIYNSICNDISFHYNFKLICNHDLCFSAPSMCVECTTTSAFIKTRFPTRDQHDDTKFVKSCQADANLLKVRGGQT